MAKSLTFRDHTLHLVRYQGKVWFLGSDLFKMLFDKPNHAIAFYRRLPEEDCSLWIREPHLLRHARILSKAGVMQLSRSSTWPYRSLFQDWLNQLDDNFNQPTNAHEELHSAPLDLITELTAIRNRLNILLEQHA